MHRSFEPLLSGLPESVRCAVWEALDSATWTKVRRALSAFDECPPELQGPEATVQILSTFSVDSIEPALRLGLQCIPCRAKLEFAPVNTVVQHLLDRTSAVYSGRYLASVILWRIEELLPDLYYPFSSGGAKEMKRRSEKLQARMKNMVRAYLEAGSSPLFLSTIPVPTAFGGVVLNSQLGSGVLGTIAAINATIFEEGSLDSRVRITDINWWSAQEGRACYDAQMDFMSMQPFTVRAAISLGLFLARNLRPLIVPRRKVLAVDLDNSLWGGILGEDGVEGLKLGHDFPGNVFLRIQREIKELRHQGVLLVLASKNEESEVRRAMANMPDMLLKWDDFVCRKLNFEHKYLNLREAAKELGLGIDSFALLDDSDYEREQMKVFNPEVLILNQRSDALHMLTSLLNCDAFDVHNVNEEDRQRHQDYELRSLRSPQGHEDRLEDFLMSLELGAKLEPFHDGNIDRVVQMLGKTNQFNLTTKRHRLEDLKVLLSQPGCVNLTLRLIDKFGDQGIVGVLLAVPEEGGRSLRVDSFLVSCRALGRGVEDVLWAAFVNRAVRNGVLRVSAHYIPTAKNQLVATLYDRLGLRRLEESEVGTQYVLEPVKSVRPPKWIVVEEIG